MPKRGDIINTDTFEALQYAINAGIINLADVQEKAEEMKKQELLEMNPWEIYQGADKSWYVYLPDSNKADGRRRVKRKNKKDLENLVVDYWREKTENPTIEEIFNEWNDRRFELGKIAASTQQRNQQVFRRHYSEVGRRKIKSMEAEAFQEFLEEQVAEKQLTSKAFSNLKTITRGFLKYAKRHKYISFNVEEMLDDLDTTECSFKKTIKEDYEEVFNEDEYPKIINYLCANPDMVNLGLLLLFVTGVRVGELVTLKWEDYDGQGLKIRRTETRYIGDDQHYVYGVKEFPKTAAGVRYVIIPKEYLWIMERLIKMNPFTEFIFMRSGKRLNTNTFRKRMYRVCQKTGCYRKSPHKARKTYASILDDNRIDSKLTIEQMGHTDISCTEEHYFRNRKSMDTKVKIISSIPEFQIKKNNQNLRSDYR